MVGPAVLAHAMNATLLPVSASRHVLGVRVVRLALFVLSLLDVTLGLLFGLGGLVGMGTLVSQTLRMGLGFVCVWGLALLSGLLFGALVYGLLVLELDWATSHAFLVKPLLFVPLEC